MLAITSSTILKLGSTGPDVGIVQTRLKALKFYNYSVDNKYGDKTKAAVIAYQKSKGLVQDGIAGPKTNGSLGLLPKATAKYQSDKTAFMKNMAQAIGGGFNTLTQCYNLIKANETYKFGIGDTVAQAGAVANLQKGVGNNCVDYAQLLHAVAEDLNKVAGTDYKLRYVRTYCTKDQVGHVYIEVQGGEFAKGRWTPVDGAAGASPGSKYPIGKAWCMDYPDKIYNQKYLEKDDGI